MFDLSKSEAYLCKTIQQIKGQKYKPNILRRAWQIYSDGMLQIIFTQLLLLSPILTLLEYFYFLLLYGLTPQHFGVK